MFPRDVTVVIPTIPGRHGMYVRAVMSVSQQDEPPTGGIEVELDVERTGAAATRNRALERVNTTWVAFLDDDDEFYPMHIRTCLDALEKSGADLVYPYPDFGDQRDPLAVMHRRKIVLPFGIPFGREQEWYLRTVGNFIPVTHMCRTSLVKKVGGFPDQNGFPCDPQNNSKDCEDFGLLLRLLDAGAKFTHVPEVTWRYHIHESNTGGRAGG